MSWKDNIETIEFELITGDGKSWFPKWTTSVKNVNFNTEGFNFVGVQGTYVAREKQQGAQYPIELYFDSEDHLDVAYNFDISSQNKNVWTINHPIFGKIICQPLSLSYDSTGLSYTKITGTVWETLTEKLPRQVQNITKTVGEIYIEIQSIILGKKTVDSETRESEVIVGDLDGSSIATATETIDIIEKYYTILPQINEQTVWLKNKIRNCSAAIQELIQEPIRFIEQLQSLISFPFEIEQNIVSKINELKNVLDDLINIGDLSLFESTATSILSFANYMAVNATYDKNKDVADTISLLKSMNDSILSYYETNGIIQDFQLYQKQDLIYNLTIANLYEIGLSSKQERTVILEYDSNPILLTHRFYGFSDVNLDRFVSENDLTIEELLFIKKGKKIIWYV